MAEREGSEAGGDARVLKGAAAGLIAGLLAAFAMDRFQAGVSALSSSKPKREGEPATEQAADRLAEAMVGHEVAAPDKAFAGQLVHYALGAALGVGYGVAAELYPAVTTGFGTAFGTAVTVVFDESAVPAAGLGTPPWKTSASTHLYTLVSHLVFGTTAEFTRRQVRATL